jgi:hypothetical protein
MSPEERRAEVGEVVSEALDAHARGDKRHVNWLLMAAQHQGAEPSEMLEAFQDQLAAVAGDEPSG